jgi:3-phosphoshikimate 1-carboxyvinyltransferase
MQSLGVNIDSDGDELLVTGCGLRGLRSPGEPLYCGNSGTTLRLLTGLLAGQDFSSSLTGDKSLDRRPMGRIINPLKGMGAVIEEMQEEHKRIIRVSGTKLHGINYSSPIASAQVKSAILLAGLYADSPVRVEEPFPSRDHTERMMAAMGASIQYGPAWAELEPGGILNACDIYVPADFSSAAFFIVAGLITPDSSIRLDGVMINPTRSGLLELLREMGGNIEVENVQELGGETIADLVVCSSSLKAVDCPPEKIPSMIDEIPILAIAAAVADGTTHIRGAKELRKKETDRLKAVATELAALGVPIEEQEDGLSIKGPVSFKKASVKSYGDHRMAMALTIAAGIAQEPIEIQDYECTAVSYPGFLNDWEKLTK